MSEDRVHEGSKEGLYSSHLKAGQAMNDNDNHSPMEDDHEEGQPNRNPVSKDCGCSVGNSSGRNGGKMYSETKLFQ